MHTEKLIKLVPQSFQTGRPFYRTYELDGYHSPRA